MPYSSQCGVCLQFFTSTVRQSCANDNLKHHEEKRVAAKPFECSCGYKNCLENSMNRAACGHLRTEKCDWVCVCISMGGRL